MFISNRFCQYSLYGKCILTLSPELCLSLKNSHQRKKIAGILTNMEKTGRYLTHDKLLSSVVGVIRRHKRSRLKTILWSKAYSLRKKSWQIHSLDFARIWSMGNYFLKIKVTPKCHCTFCSYNKPRCICSAQIHSSWMVWPWPCATQSTGRWWCWIVKRKLYIERIRAGWDGKTFISLYFFNHITVFNYIFLPHKTVHIHILIRTNNVKKCFK